MASWNLGSVSGEIFNLVDNIPNSVSGNTLLALIDRKRLFMEQRTGLTIGSTGIAEKFQPALTDLSIAALLRIMNTQGADVQSISLGQFSINKGGRSNIIESAETYEKSGMEALQAIGTARKYYRAF